MLKALDGRVTLENDVEDREVALQSQRGGGVSVYTNDGDGIESKRRRLHFDDPGEPETSAEFKNLDTLTLEGFIKIREETGDNPQLFINPDTNREQATLNAADTLRLVAGGDLALELASDGTIHVYSRLQLRGNALQGLREVEAVLGTRDLSYREVAIDTANDRLVHRDSDGTVRYWDANGTL